MQNVKKLSRTLPHQGYGSVCPQGQYGNSTGMAHYLPGCTLAVGQTGHIPLNRDDLAFKYGLAADGMLGQLHIAFPHFLFSFPSFGRPSGPFGRNSILNIISHSAPIGKDSPHTIPRTAKAPALTGPTKREGAEPGSVPSCVLLLIA